MTERKKKNQKASTGKAPEAQPSSPSSGRRAAEWTRGPKFEWKLFAIWCGAIALTVIICFADTLFMGIVFNDQVIIGKLRMSNPQTFFVPLWAAALVAPLTQPWLQASYMQDLLSYGVTYGWYHLVNVFLHLSSCLALFCLILRITWRLRNEKRTTLDPWIVAGASSLLFACHPLAVQSAAYISGRYMALAGSNFLLALNMFLVGLLGRSTSARAWGFGLAFLFSIMAITSNEVALALPPTMLALFFLLKPNSRDWQDWAVEHPFICGVLPVLSLALPLTFFLGFHEGYTPDFYGVRQLDTPAYTATQAKAFLTYYTRCFFIPLGLSLDPPFTQASGWSDPLSLSGALLIVGLLLAMIRCDRFPVLRVGIGLTLAGYLPHACIAQPNSVADSLFYVSLAGMAIIAGWILSKLYTGRYHAFVKYGAPALLVCLIGVSLCRTLEWGSDEKLFAATLRTNENSGPALAWSSYLFLSQKDYSKAITYADRALANAPDLATAYLAKGSALVSLHRSQEAAVALRKADELSTAQRLPIQSAVKFALADVAIQLGKPAGVEKLVIAGLTGDPRNPRALYILGMAAYEKGDYRRAHALLGRGAQLGVTDALPTFVECAIRLNHNDEALGAARSAVQYADSARSQMALAEALYANKQMSEAETAFKNVLKLQPQDPSAMAYLSLVYTKKGEAALAQNYRVGALKQDRSVFSHVPLPVSDLKSASSTKPSVELKASPSTPVSPGAITNSKTKEH